MQVGGRNDGSEGRTKILDSGPSGCKEAWWNQDGGRLKIFELALFHLGNDAVETKHLEKPHITRFHDCLDKTSYQEDEIPPLLRRTISRNYFVSHSLLPMLCLDTGCDDVMGGCRIIQTGALPTSLYTSAKVYTTQLLKCLLCKGLNSNP